MLQSPSNKSNTSSLPPPKYPLLRTDERTNENRARGTHSPAGDAGGGLLIYPCDVTKKGVLDREARQTRYGHPPIYLRTWDSSSLSRSPAIRKTIIHSARPSRRVFFFFHRYTPAAKINSMVVLKSPLTPSHFLTKVKICNPQATFPHHHTLPTPTRERVSNLITHSNTAFQGLLFTIPSVELRYTIAHEQSSPSTDRTNFSQLDLREGRPRADVR